MALPRGSISTLPNQPILALGRLGKSLAMSRGDVLAALAVAEGCASRWRDTPEVAMALKAAVAAMGTTDPGGLADPLIAAIVLPVLRANSLVDRMSLARAPLNVTFPQFTGDATAYAGTEGSVKPFSKFSTATMTLSPRKVTAAAAFTRDLIQVANDSAIETFIGEQLAAAAVRQMDRQFADPRVTGSISNGATTIVSGGTTIAALDADFRSALMALAAVGDAALVNAAWIISTKLAAHLVTLRSTNDGYAYPGVSVNATGRLCGLPCFVTGGMTGIDSPSESHAILLDQASVFFGDAGAANVTVTEEASVQLDDAPAAGATALRSLWQSNLIALRAERWCGWTRRATTSVIAITDIQVG